LEALTAAERSSLLKTLSVLFVDDDELLRMQAQGFLGHAVQALHLAGSSQEGLFSFALHQPDLVVLDVNMPGMGGLELGRALRAVNPDVPLVLLTGMDDAEVFRRAIALGVNSYLSKPLEPIKLLEALTQAASTLHLKQELKRQLRLTELMIDAAPSPSLLMSQESGRVVSCNQLAKVLGYAEGAPCEGPLIPRKLLDKLRQGGECLMDAACSQEVSAHGRHWVLHWAPVGHDTLLFTAVDITQRVTYEQFRTDVELMARHDLKTPLSAFTAVPDLLLESDNLTEDQREFIRLIRDAGTRMLGMINLSLDLFKMEAGTYALPDKRFDFATLVAASVRGTHTMGRSLGVGLLLENAQQPVPVRGDEQLCQSLLDNLLKNALEAAPQNSTVEVSVLAEPVPQVRIRNQGEVPLDIRERFFEKYATSGKRMGTGLGTYSAQMVARAHGGQVLLDTDTPGETTVTVLFPEAE